MTDKTPSDRLRAFEDKMEREADPELHPLPIKWGDAQQFNQELFEEPQQDGGGVEPKVTLLSMTPEPLRAIAAMCAMYEGRVVRDLADLDEDYVRQKWADVLATHLDTPLEAVQLHFLIEGVDRAFTHQLVRQRVGAAYAQESLRFAVVEDLKSATTLPPSLAGTKPLGLHGPDEGPISKEQDWRNVWERVLSEIDWGYRRLVDSGMPAEEARGLLPHCTATRIHYVTNLRALSDHAGNRLCTQAQFHWRLVFAQIIDAIRNYMGPGAGPSRWQYEAIADSALFRPVCFKLGRCPFKASFDRACSIRERVDANAALGRPSVQWHVESKPPEGLGINPIPAIQPAEWLANPGAARA